MVQVIEQEGNAAGRIGKGFAQGLSEQLPKELSTSRLSHGLKRLAEQDLSGKNRIGLLSELYAIPGMTTDIANQAVEQLINQNFQTRSVGQTAQQPNVNAGQRIMQSKENIPSVGENGFASPSQIREYKKGLLQEPSSYDVRSLANDFLSQGIAQTRGEAMALANQEIKQDLQSQRQKNQALKSDLDERLKLSLQGRGLGDFKDVAGQIQRDLVDQAEYMVNKLEMTPEDASAQIENIALDLGKASNKLKDTGSFWNMFRKSSTKATELRSQRKDFAKYGFGELFDDMVSGRLGISPLQTAHVLDPLKNKEIKKEIDSTKSFPGLPYRKLSDKALDKIIKNIKPEDNLYAIEYLLRDKYLDVNAFKKRVEELQDKKEISLQPQQKRQLDRPVSNSFSGDLLYQAF